MATRRSLMSASATSAPVPRSSGGLLTRIAYTSDSKFLLCCSGYVIKLFSTVTGAQVRTLVGHTAEVTAVVQHPTLELQAFSASVDGRILLWDLDEAKVLRVVCVGLPILAMALDAAQTEPTAIVLTGGGGSEAPPSDVPVYCQGLVHAGRVYSVGLGRKAIESQTDWAASYLARLAAARPAVEGAEEEDEGMAVVGPSATTSSGGGGAAISAGFGSSARPWPAAATFLFKARGATALAVGRCGGGSSVVGALCGKMLRLHDVAAGTLVDVNQRREMTCFALSPTEPLAASGDDCGRICLWRVDGGASGPLRASERHWHAQRLGALAFSADGAYLYSAGREGVLVSWQLDSAHRGFLPRLGAPLTALATTADGTGAAVLGADNTVRLIDLARNEVRLHVHGLLLASRMAADARTRSVVLHGGGAGGRLQWWAPQYDKQIDSLEVAPRNVSGSLPALGGATTDERRRALRSTAAAGGAALVQVRGAE